MKISLCIIVKDEGRGLEEFLLYHKDLVDEIIVVDTGSTDNTIEIARKYTDKIFNFKWNDDFSAARNYSISKALGDWILWLDPDEIISEKDLEKIKEFNDNKYLGYRFVQKTTIGAFMNVQGICKMFKNNKGIKFIYPVHESVMPSIREKNGLIRYLMQIEH